MQMLAGSAGEMSPLPLDQGQLQAHGQSLSELHQRMDAMHHSAGMCACKP